MCRAETRGHNGDLRRADHGCGAVRSQTGGYAVSSDEFETDSENAPIPLTAADLQKARAELSECMDPREFRRRVHHLDTVRKFSDNKYKFLREAWVLAELSKHKSFVRIQLGEDPPDGYVQTENGNVLKIEITSVQTPERALGTEYSDKKNPEEYDPIEDVEVFAKVLEDAIKKKVNEQNRACVLVVDQNIVNAIITPDKKENAIVSIKGKYAREFKDLWILWNDKVF
jgi:hypothetical protein